MCLPAKCDIHKQCSEIIYLANRVIAGKLNQLTVGGHLMPITSLVTFSHAICVTGDEQTFFSVNFFKSDLSQVSYHVHNSDIRSDKR
jgi:Na+(H+)/acetate symporter ActP